MNKNVLLLSIKQKYVDLIMKGTKTVELRRIRPRVSNGDQIAVYIPSPVKALVGVCVVEEVIAAPIEDLWDQVASISGISREEFDRYYEGSSIGYAIAIGKPVLLDSPVNLNTLRERWGANFHPPQSYRYLNNEQASYLGESKIYES